MNLNLIKKICDECIAEGENVLSSTWVRKSMGGIRIANPTSYVDLEKFERWKSNCNVLLNILGNLAKPWIDTFSGIKNNEEVNATAMQGALKSLKHTIENGYLISIEDLIFAETFSNLIEQAEYLLEQKYYLPSAVLSRAVLEEKLRSICSREEIEFSKSRPTLSDYNQALYKSNFYSKVEYKNIDYLISIGNNAAHNKDFKNDDSEKLLDGVKIILNKYNT